VLQLVVAQQVVDDSGRNAMSLPARTGAYSSDIAADA